MIREYENFISLTDRVKLAHNKNVYFLVSININSYQNKNLCGASIWILSNQESDTESINQIRDEKSLFI